MPRPYDYNSLVVKVCRLGSNIYNHRLRYAVNDLFNISSTNIIGFTLENTTTLIEPYWPSITMNGLSVKLELNNNKVAEEHDVNQSISNNASQDKYQMIASTDDETVRVHKYFISSSFLYEQ